MKPIINLFLRSAIITINPELIVFKDLISIEQATDLIYKLREKLNNDKG